MDRQGVTDTQSFADDGVILRREDGVAWLTINNPDRLNAMRLNMWEALGSVGEMIRDSNTRVVVISGAGTRAFSVGADISEFPEVRSTKTGINAYNQTVSRALNSLARLPMPVVACIHGHCIGGGLEIALRCDLRIAANDASFAFTPAKLGLAVGAEEVSALARIAGPAATAELLYTAQPVSAERAEVWGLVNRIAPPSQLPTVVQALANAIAKNAPLTLRAAKAGLAAFAAPCDTEKAIRADELVGVCYASADYKEGQMAFAEKRSPEFKGI